MLGMLWRRENRTVLIVSEAALEPALNSAFLRQPEIRLLTSYPDHEGMVIARRERPRLIIEDIVAPAGCGVEFCRELRADPRTSTIPLIVVATPEARAAANVTARADALLQKPVARRDLFTAVCRFLPLPRRRTRRLTTNLRFAYRLDNTVGQAFSRDISTSGVFLKTDRLLPLGTRVELRFRLPGAWEELRCDALVRNTVQVDGHVSQRRGIGLEFLDLPEDDMDRLDAFIERHLARPRFARLF